MSMYHINSEGKASICRAKKGNCPYGGTHYPDKASALRAETDFLRDRYQIFNIFDPNDHEDANVSDFPEENLSLERGKTVSIKEKAKKILNSVLDWKDETLEAIEEFYFGGTQSPNSSMIKAGATVVTASAAAVFAVIGISSIAVDNTPHSGTVISTHYTPESTYFTTQIINRIPITTKHTTPECYGVQIQAQDSSKTGTWCVSQKVFESIQQGQQYTAQSGDTVEGTLR